jgi:hypothetical protein
MKIKQYLTITDPVDFLRGNYYDCFNLFSHATTVSDWICCGEIEFDVDVDTCKVRDVAVQEIETKLTAARVLLDQLESQKRDLLAIGYDDPANRWLR